MKTKFSIIILLLITVMIACTKTPPPEIEPPTKDTLWLDDTTLTGFGKCTIKEPHYILQFFKPKNFEFFASLNATYKLCLFAYYWDATYSYSDDKNSPAGRKYNELCERYGDTKYTTERSFAGFYDGGYDYMMDNISSIELIAQTNYDEQHPAGSSLNDICMIKYQSPRNYIAKGYVGLLDQITKPLFECTSDDFVLMGCGNIDICSLHLTRPHTKGVEQQVTAIITDETGRVYTITTAPFTW